jgi:hypothetical protein
MGRTASKMAVVTLGSQVCQVCPRDIGVHHKDVLEVVPGAGPVRGPVGKMSVMVTVTVTSKGKSMIVVGETLLRRHGKPGLAYLKSGRELRMRVLSGSNWASHN